MNPDRFDALRADLAAAWESGDIAATRALSGLAEEQCSPEQREALAQMLGAALPAALTDRLQQYQQWESERQRDWQREEERRDRWSRIEAAAVAFFDPETVTPCQAVDYAEALVDEVDRRRAATERTP